MEKKAILFDLDGTLTDSGEGIMKCAKMTLERYGIPVPDIQTLRVFVGPPLHDMFVKFGIPEEKTDEAVAIYRSRYVTKGKFENTPYPGIISMLEKLRDAGFDLYVATSKPEAVSKEILSYFDMAKYFTVICGASLDKSRTSKESVIAYLLEQIGKDAKMVMVGDTAFDVIGAAHHGIPAIGVAWGYGSVEEMTAAGAFAIARDAHHLYELLIKE